LTDEDVFALQSFAFILIGERRR